jgi:cytochrome b pre-mRNA-processing protein 3
MLKIPGKSKKRATKVETLHAALVNRAREPAFYARFGVADTLDGRFDLLALHAFLLLERLREARQGDLAQSLTDTIFLSFDEGLRDLGTGDMGMGRRMKAMADAFYGRMQAYDTSRNLDAMAAALGRNVYRGAEGFEARSRALAHYVFSARDHLARSNVAEGMGDFGPLPGEPEP